MFPYNTNWCIINSTNSSSLSSFQTTERVRLSRFTYLGLELLKISEELNYWVRHKCKTPLATLRAQRCTNAERGSGGGAQIWHQIASLAPPVHFHSSLLFGSGDSLKLSLDLHRYPSSGQKGKTGNQLTLYTWNNQAAGIQCIGFGTTFKELINHSEGTRLPPREQ